MLSRIGLRHAFVVFSLLALVLNTLALIAVCSVTGVGSVAITAALLVSSAVLVGIGVVLGRHFAGRAEAIVAALNKVGKGDLTHRLQMSGKDDFAWLAYEYDVARKGVAHLVEQIQQGAHAVGQGVAQLVSSSQKISEASAAQSQAAIGINHALDQAATSIAQVADNTQQARGVADQASVLASSGSRGIDTLVREIESTSSSVQSSSQLIAELGNKSETISSIVLTIKGIAEQTNLLALNAAIEAARAGEQGRGFAVVADEVRKLAERSSSAANEINTMISSMVKGTQQAVIGMDDCVKQVDAGVVLARDAGASVLALDESARRTRAQIEDIATAMQTQSQATQAIVPNVELIRRMSQDTDEAVRRSEEVVRSLSALSGDLQSAVANFRAH